MNTKAVVKIVKRKDLEQSIHITSPQSQIAEESNTAPKTESHSRRQIVTTVSNWVKECRERNRIEEIEGLRNIFGDAPILSKA